jgi:predicted ATPase/class 3 adenylate cyclase
LASPGAILLEGERRVATVLVTDMASSVQVLEVLGTEAWVELMNRVLHLLEAEIYRFGGEVSQFRGDGLVAFFGVAGVHEDDPERAVMAALSMQQALKRHAGELARRADLDLRLRVGINTGEVIVASVGDRRQHSEETAMGIAVAIASRMENAAEPGTILVSEYTQRLVEAQFEWLPLGEIPVKGVSRPLAVYRPLAPKVEPDAKRAIEVFQYTPVLVGREAEVQAFKACIDGLLAGRGGIALVTGDRGSGKSLLVNDTREYVAHRGALLAEAAGSQDAPALTWIRGRCRSYQQSWPYSLWVDLLRDWLGSQPGESKEARGERLRVRAEALWGAASADFYPYLASLLALPVDQTTQERIGRLTGEDLRHGFYQALRSWLETLARQGPLVVQLSDAQWADESSLSLLRGLLPLCDNEAILWAILFRPERGTPMWTFRQEVETDYPHRLTAIDLAPLTAEQGQALIESLLGAGVLPDETLSLILKNAEGNPFYIVELIVSLSANGVLVREPDTGRWRMSRTPTTLDLPGSLQRLLLARIDRLSPEERYVLQVAAVIGSVFWLSALEYVAAEARALRADLAALQRAQLIQEAGRAPEMGMQYTFRTPLIREAAYDGLLSAQRATFHLRAAEYLETHLDPEAVRGYYGLLAYHYRGADNPGKELLFTLLAADQARTVFANAEALQHYNRAEALLDQLQASATGDVTQRALTEQRFEALAGRREVLIQMGRLEAAWSDARALLPLAGQMADDLAWRVDALLAQPEVADWENREQLHEALRLAQEALDTARQLRDRRREMRSLIALARLRLWQHSSEGFAIAEQGLALARELGDLRTEVNLLFAIAAAYGMDNVPRAQHYIEAALARSEQLDDKMTEFRLLAAMSGQFERRGDYYRQLTDYELKRLALSREMGNPITEGLTVMMCGQIQALYLGDYDGGLALEREALRIWEHFADRVFVLLRMAQIQIGQGRLDAARATLEQAQPLSERRLNDLARAGHALVTALYCNAVGDDAHLRRGLAVASSIEPMAASSLVSRQYYMAAAAQMADAHLGLARLSAADESERATHAGQALAASQTALNLYNDFGFVQIIECTSEEVLFRHSQALAANGRAQEATEFSRRAYDEMMRKHALIPPESHYRHTYLDNIRLHRDIRLAVEPVGAE